MFKTLLGSGRSKQLCLLMTTKNISSNSKTVPELEDEMYDETDGEDEIEDLKGDPDYTPRKVK
jgi:hypothetical protein